MEEWVGDLLGGWGVPCQFFELPCGKIERWWNMLVSEVCHSTMSDSEYTPRYGELSFTYHCCSSGITRNRKPAHPSKDPKIWFIASFGYTYGIINNTNISDNVYIDNIGDIYTEKGFKRIANCNAIFETTQTVPFIAVIANASEKQTPAKILSNKQIDLIKCGNWTTRSILGDFIYYQQEQQLKHNKLNAMIEKLTVEQEESKAKLLEQQKLIDMLVKNVQDLQHKIESYSAF